MKALRTNLDLRIAHRRTMQVSEESIRVRAREAGVMWQYDCWPGDVAVSWRQTDLLGLRSIKKRERVWAGR